MTTTASIATLDGVMGKRGFNSMKPSNDVFKRGKVKAMWDLTVDLPSFAGISDDVKRPYFIKDESGIVTFANSDDLNIYIEKNIINA